MNAAENTIVATDVNAGDAMLDDLLSSLDAGGASIESVIATDAAAGVPGMVNLVNDIAALAGNDPLAGLDDSILETIEGDNAGTIEAKGADVSVDPVDEIIEGAIDAVAAAPAEPETPVKAKKGGAKKGGKKKTTVPAGYGSDGEEAKQPDAGAIEAKGEDAPDAGPEDAAPPAAAEPKAPRVSSITHKPGDLLIAKLGTDNAAALLVFDDRHDGEQIQAEHAEFIHKMNITSSNAEGYIADKVRDKILMFFVWLKNGGQLNEVMKRAITVLHQDGKITTGAKGNLYTNLLSKPYSTGTAASQSNQMQMMLPILGMTLKSKGEMTPNPHSPLLQMAYAGLGLK
jgi:hypothetical protein